MDYKTISQEEKDKALVSFLKGQEMDLFLANINKDRYRELLKNDKISQGFREKIEKLLESTLLQITDVEAVVEATEKQLPSKRRIEKILKEIE